jgi:putative intracellular protease/amidase
LSPVVDDDDVTAALCVVSEQGYWGEECVEPLSALEAAGVEVDVATPGGGPPVVDERSADPAEVGEALAERVRAVDDRLSGHPEPAPLATVDATDYDAVVFPGGHGALWDVAADRHARQLLLRTVAGDAGVVLVVSHAVGLLAFTREADGSFLADGRSVTGVPTAWDRDVVDDADRLPDGRKLPYAVEHEVRAAGADWDSALDAAEAAGRRRPGDRARAVVGGPGRGDARRPAVIAATRS